ncbi:hypothetical protein [Fischerella sp. JS2]|uniref:hypothetical protein n=1 Tax=Fischerella sp. JS2 TaxID=2597771 RepID=UPI0028E224FA|nr:hypothetical protein [Fischerella sp. JS2]
MNPSLINLEAIFNLTVKETEELVKLGIDISDPSVVTSLKWYANKYLEIAERCNNALMELIDKQAATTPKLVAAYCDVDMDSF